MYLLLFLPLTMAQAASNTTACSWDFPTQMGSGGGILMFFLGFMTGALVIGLIWLLMDQRWRSWHVFGKGGGAPAGYAPIYPSLDPAQQQGYPPQQQQGYPQQTSYAWAIPPGMSGYRTEYDVIPAGY